MSADKVARLLTDFDRPELPKARSRVVPFDHALHSTARPAAPKPQAVPVDDGYQRGLAEGYANARAEFEQKLNDERNRFNAQIEDEQRGALSDAAAKIVSDIGEIGPQLQAKIADVTARVLEPFITNVVQRQAAASFVERLSSIITDTRRPAVRISGPSDLIEMVRSQIGAKSGSVELRVEAVPEVSIVVDQIVLETQVKIWADRLKLAFLS